MKVRKSVAAAAIAAAAVLVAAGCSEAEDAADTATSAVEEATSEAGSAAETATSEVEEAVSGDLSAEDATEILRKAVDPETSDEDLDEVLAAGNPGAKAGLQAFARGGNAAGYTPDVYTVKSVEEGEDGTATGTVEVAGPHGTADIELTFVEEDGDWKLSGDAVEQLSSMMPGGQ